MCSQYVSILRTSGGRSRDSRAGKLGILTENLERKLILAELAAFRESGWIKPRRRRQALDKIEILKSIEAAIEGGSDGLSHGKILAALGASRGRPEGDRPDPTVKKALYDLGRALSDWYRAHPDRPHRVEIGTDGTVSSDDHSLLERSAQQLTLLKDAMERLPSMLEQQMPLRRNHAPPLLGKGEGGVESPDWILELPQCQGLRGLWYEHLESVRDTLSNLVLHHLSSLVARYSGRQIVVVQQIRHRVEAWSDALQILDEAYEVFSRGADKSIVRIVVLPDDRDAEWWRRLWWHIGSRLKRNEEIWAIASSDIEIYRPALDHDLILLEGELVGLVQTDDDYPKHLVGVHPDDPQGLEIQNRLLEVVEDTRNDANERLRRCDEEQFLSRAYSTEALSRWLSGFGIDTGASP